ncbi:zinc finger protein [Macleaya cordata]|uniref:RING-type E3 ubiquitin transferase n=1 Tax=Macleaya cordata TaxID=56857 RepID=A0A200PSA4_MACCD|nr:zinc finger protein [Macleaya cordata]
MSYSYSEPPSCCSTASSELKLYQTFIFSIPIFFTFLLLLLFYLFYLRRRRVDWSSLRMRAPYHSNGGESIPRFSESGLKKELREMLPIIVFKESFSVRDTQCSVCLADYQADDKLQQIPACRHTFHMECIDHWLSTHTTCPLCRLSLVPVTRTDSDPPDSQMEAQDSDQFSESSSENGRSSLREAESESGEEESSSYCVGTEEEFCNARREEQDEECGPTGEGSITVLIVEANASIEQGTMRDHPSETSHL